MRLSDRLTPQWRHRLFVAYLVAMALVFLTPTPETGIESRYVDKLIHFGLFFGFALVFHLDSRATPGRTFLMSTMFAGSVELVQGILPFRDAEWGDFVAGAAGAALATIPLLLIERRTRSMAAGSRLSGPDS